MAHPDPTRRRQIASMAANVSWSRTAVRAERLAPANRAREQKWERLVDPDGAMKPADRVRAAESARKAHYQRISALGVEARRRKAAAARAA
ncbi:hypothetical protein [Nocardiopsis dassonvillei]|uniref:hypothetical protein n=1 Tax=Nocardiopsis dassonvillei TaxID=2014 RepID=UPI00362857E2